MRSDRQRLDPVLADLRALLPELRERYAVDTLEVFGSRVRGDASHRSDVDVLVTFTETPDLLTFIALEDELVTAPPTNSLARAKLRRMSSTASTGSRSAVKPEADPKTLYSVVRALEVVGEATKRVPPSVRSLDAAIPWKEMAGMRDRLIHDYDNVDVELVL